MCTEVNSAMGLQATAATKRKHELTFDSKDTNTYTNCPPPVKTSKWSLNNNNYIDAVEEEIVNGFRSSNKSSSHHNGISTDNKACEISYSSSVASISLRNGKEVPKSTAFSKTSPAMLNTIVTSIPSAAEGDPTTPLPPTSTTPVPEDSIAKLEVVANVACEPWTSAPEPVDCISKLQAVAVPSDPWGSISTRSTLATTLLSADELDDDDDDFEDDYEEEESIIPTYCPLRYHTFPSSNSSTSLQGQRLSGNFQSSAGQNYVSRPNYYSEPFPQQNCSRTGSPPHMRSNNGSGFSWPSGANNSSFYSSAEPAYPPQQQQQTIRCAENGKSYLELGCSSPVPTPNNSPILPPPVPFISAAHEARHPIKRCCDGRGTWCNNNKNCYKDIRLKIRNLSMFKLSRFRQVSEQSLYRSVLICNTLKRIDREIETEAKELHQATAHAAQHQPHHLQHSLHQQPQYHHHIHSHMQIQSPMPVHNSHHQPQNLQHHSQQPMLHPQHQDYMPVLNCGRLGGNVEYHNQQQQQQSAQQTFHQQQYQTERVLDISTSNFQNSLHKASSTANQFGTSHGSSNCAGLMATTTTLHPYDHYPFRESNSGRVTPFPCQPVISTPPPASVSSATSAPATPSSSSQVQSTVAASSTSTNLSPASTTLISDSDSGFAEDDSTRSINWSSVLSLSSQSALDPLNNNDIFSILPPANPATAVPVSVAPARGSNETCPSSTSVSISGTFTAVQSSGAMSSSNTCNNTSTTPPSATTTATFTTLSTISSATHSLTSSYVTSMNSNSASISTWEYGFLDMEFGLGTEFTELSPSCKFSSADDFFKNSITPVSSTRYDNELEQPAHIMVGS